MANNRENVATFFIAVAALILLGSIVLSFMTLTSAKNRTTPCTTVTTNTPDEDGIIQLVPFTKTKIAPQNYFEPRQFYLERLPEQNGRYQFTINDITDKIGITNIDPDSRSMNPFLDPNAHVLYRKPHSFDDVKIGDIIIFNATLQQSKYDVLLIMHQVVDKRNNKYITKGFNNPIQDDYNITIKETVGIIVGVLY